MKELIERICEYSALDNNEIAALESISSKKNFQKGQSVLKINQTSRKLYYIQKGLLKVSFHNESKEYIMRFFYDNEFCAVLDSLFDEGPSQYEIVAIRDTTIIEIDYGQLTWLASKAPSFEKIISGISSMATTMMMKRIRELLECEGKQKYLNFLKENSHLVEYISLLDLSGYLGISQVSLSRIRAEL